MTNLLSELEAVVGRIESDGSHRRCVDFLRTHHAEIAAAVRDAILWRHARDNTGNGLRVVVWNKGAPDDLDVLFPSPNLLKNKRYIDAAMSAREGQG